MAKKKSGKAKAELVTKKEFKPITRPLKRNAYNTYNREIKHNALAYYSVGYSTNQISKALDIPTKTLQSWFNGDFEADDAVVSAYATKIKESLQSSLILKANRCFTEALKDEKMDKASTLQLVTAGSIMVDKQRLLAGESTENHSHFHWSRNKKQVNEDVSKDEELLDQLESDIQALNQ